MDATISKREEPRYKIYDPGKELDNNLSINTNNIGKY